MRRVGHEHLRPLLAARLVIGADHEDARELALGAGRGLERDGVHPGDLGEVPRQLVHELERTLRQGLGRQRMDLGEAGQPRHVLVELRVVLHRARAERIEVRVESVVQPRQARVMADYVELGDFRQPGGIAPEMLGRQELARVGFGHIGFR